MAADVRRRRTLGTNREVCSVCGHQGLDVVESRRVRRGHQLLQLRWDPDVRRYNQCPNCGSKQEREGGRHRA